MYVVRLKLVYFYVIFAQHNAPSTTLRTQDGGGVGGWWVGWGGNLQQSVVTAQLCSLSPSDAIFLSGPFGPCQLCCQGKVVVTSEVTAGLFLKSLGRVLVKQTKESSFP